MFLPCDETLVARSHRRYHVVGVHEDVDEGVGQPEEGAVATCDGSQPLGGKD